MNEQIFKLALKAMDFQGAVDTDTELKLTNSELEKFADSIVEECMWKIMQRKEEAIDNDWHVDEAMSTALSDISEHFGVEE